MYSSHSAGSSGISGTSMPAMFSLTMARSNGLSSTNTILSKPIFSTFCMALMLSTLVSQLAMKTAISSSRSTMSGCFSKGSRALSSSFFEQTHIIMPLWRNFFTHIWNSVYALPMPSP